MRIFIVGCGKIGQTLAQQLVAESHDVTIIDTDERVLANINNTLDVICYAGNGASYLTLRDAGAQDADLVIAVTESDEVNMLPHGAQAGRASHRCARAQPRLF